MDITLEKAVEILGLKGISFNNETIKKAYRRLASKYHPDKNKNGLIFMQQINIARDYLFTFTDDQLLSYSQQNTYKNQYNNFNNQSEEMEDELSIFRSYGLYVYTKGEKIIIEGKTYNYKEELKWYGFRWNPEKKIWWKYS